MAFTDQLVKTKAKEWPPAITVVRMADGSMFILQSPWCPTAGSEIATYVLKDPDGL